MTGVRPKSFTPSIFKGSEEVVEYPCTPCARDGSAIEAVKFCADCSELFCLSCTKQHTKFGFTSTHKVVDRAKAARHADSGKKSATTPAQLQLPTERCEDHNGELMTNFCRDHDVVVCNSCATMDHRSCNNMVYIPKVSSHSKPRQDVSQVKDELSASLGVTKAARLHVQKRKIMVNGEKAKHATTIKATTESLIAHAREMEKSALDVVTRRHQEASDKIETELMQLDDTEKRMEKRLNDLEHAEERNESQVFVDTKMGRREAGTARTLGQRLTSTDADYVKSTFVVENGVDVFLNDVNALGEVVVGPYKAVFKGKYDVSKFFKDELTCDITDACELPNGEILLIDYFNNCIKKIDTNFKVVKRFKLPSDPFGICQTRKNEAAVTLFKVEKVQFVDISDSWKLTTTFQVGGRCRGIAYSRSELFVACPYFVEIYDLSGSLLRQIQYDSLGNNKLSFLSYIIVSNDGNSFHVTDKEKGITTMDRHGNIINKISENLHSVNGLITINSEYLIVCGNSSNNVLQISTDGGIVAELLNSKDGLKKPQCVIYSRSRASLFVMCEASNKIHMFTLISKDST